MIEIRLDCLKCFLTVTLVVCTFIVGSGARANGGISGTFASASASAHAHVGAGATALSNAGATALSNAGAYGGASDLSGVYDGHKGIRSYDNVGLSYDNDANRGARPYAGAAQGHGDGIKGSDHGYNKNRCSKCKWENDDYWERDEPEEEGDENDEYECDDGQYRPYGTRHHGAGGPDKGHKPGFRPSGVHKTGPTGVYVDDGAGGRPTGPFGNVNYPAPTTGYAAPSFATGSTPKPGSGWTTPSTYTTLKPVHAGAIAGASAGAYGNPQVPIISNSWPNWNRGASTSRPGQGLNTGFDNTPTTGFPRKPASGWNTGLGGPTGSFGVTPKPAPNWNTGPDSISAGLPFSRKPGVPSWSTGRDGTTPKPGQSWNAQSDKPEPSWNSDYGPTSTGTSGCSLSDPNCTQGKKDSVVKLGATPFNIDKMKGSESPSISSAGPQTGRDISSPNSYGSPKENQNWPYGRPGIHSTSAFAGASATVSDGSTSYGGAPNFGKKDHPFFNKPPSTQTPYTGIDQVHPNTSGGTYNSENVPDYNKPGRENTWPPSVANTFDTTKRPYEGISPSGIQDNTLSPGKLLEFPTGSSVHNYPGVTKSSYGSTNPWLNIKQLASNTLHTSGTTSSPAGFPVSTGFGTTKSPFGHTNIPSSTSLGSSYSGTGLKHHGFNTAAGSSASASAGASAFQGTFHGTHSTPYISGTTPTYEGTSRYPGIKGSSESTSPAYGIVPQGTHPDAGTGAWPGTTKSPFGHPNIPDSTARGSQYGGTGLNHHSFNIASANAGASAFQGTFHGTHSTPYIAGTTPTYEETSRYPGIKGSSGSTSPAYGIVPQSTHPDPGTGAWPGTTKSPFGHPNIPYSTARGSPYGGTGLNHHSFNTASSSASANTDASAFQGTFHGTHSTPYIAGTTPKYEETSRYPGIKGSSGSTSPAYGIVPQSTHPDVGTGAWPGTTKSPFGHPNIPYSTARGSPYGGTGLNHHSFNTASSSASANADASAFQGTFHGTHSTPYIAGTTPTYEGTSRYPGVKGSSGSTRPAYGLVPPRIHPDAGIGAWPGKQPSSGTKNWPSSQPGRELGRENETPSDNRPWPGKQPGIKTPLDGHSGTWPGKQPESSATWPSRQPSSGPESWSSEKPADESETTPGSVPSGVHKILNPADYGHFPNIQDAYGSSPVNGIGAYPGANIGCKVGDSSCNQGARITPEGSVQWNSANPFLYGTGASTPSSVSRPWGSGTTTKPIGLGNPFLDSGWRNYKPGNAIDDKNVIPHGGEKPIGQGNPFLHDNKGREDVNPNEGVIPLGGKKPEAYNPDEGVIPLGGKKPGKYNPFFGSGSSGSNSPSYTGGVSPQQENSGVYPTGSGNVPGVDPLRCKFGIFGCRTPGSGNYGAANSGKHPGGVFVGPGGGNSGNVGSTVPGRFDEPGTRDQFGHPASAESDLPPGSPGGLNYGLSNAQASSFANAKSFHHFPDSTGSGNDFGQGNSGSWSPSGVQSQGGSNSWSSSSAHAHAHSFAHSSSSSGSWSGNYPIDVKG